MAIVKSSSKISFTVTLELSEIEARALDALAGYGPDQFLNKFYELGRAYMEPHEDGLRSLFLTIRGGSGTLSSSLSHVDDARRKLSMLA